MSKKLLLFKLKTKRDPETFGLFYDMYIDRIYRFVYFKVSVQEDVEDITSEVFLKFWEYLRNNSQVKNINALVYSIARNLIIDYYRKKARKDIATEDEILQNVEDEKSQKMKRQVDAKLELQKIEGLLAKLKNEYREVVLLRFVEEYSIKEISLIMNKSVGATKVLLHRALKRLREMDAQKK